MYQLSVVMHHEKHVCDTVILGLILQLAKLLNDPKLAFYAT